MINIDKSQVTYNEKMLETYLKKNGLKLCEEYKEFLREYNGGIPESNIYENKNISISIQCFFGVGVESHNDIIKNSEILDARIPKDSLPIAEVESGDNLLISMNKKRYGKIYLWEHEKELLKDLTKYRSMKKVADSFDELLSFLSNYDVDNVSIEGAKILWVDPKLLKEMED